MAEKGPRWSTQAIVQIASIFVSIKESTGDLTIAKTIVSGIEQEVDILASNPGMGEPTNDEVLGDWLHEFLGFTIQYRPVSHPDYSIEVAAVRALPEDE